MALPAWLSSTKVSSLIERVSDPKDLKKLLRTRNNVLVLYSKSGEWPLQTLGSSIRVRWDGEGEDQRAISILSFLWRLHRVLGYCCSLGAIPVPSYEHPVSKRLWNPYLGQQRRTCESWMDTLAPRQSQSQPCQLLRGSYRLTPRLACCQLNWSQACGLLPEQVVLSLV